MREAVLRRIASAFTPDFVTPWIFDCDKPDGDKLVEYPAAARRIFRSLAM
jgi:hypothetical protein